MKIKITENQLRNLIHQELIREEQGDPDESGVEVKTTAGKKTEKLMDSNAMNALKTALDKATTKDAVKETLSQVFSSLGESGQKFLKLALKELAAEL